MKMSEELKNKRKVTKSVPTAKEKAQIRSAIKKAKRTEKLSEYARQRREKKEQATEEIYKYALAKDISDYDANVAELQCISDTITHIKQCQERDDTPFVYIDDNGVRRSEKFYVALYKQFYYTVKYQQINITRKLTEQNLTWSEIIEFMKQQ